MDNKNARQLLRDLLNIVDGYRLRKPLEKAIDLFDKDTPIAYKEIVKNIGEYESISYKCITCGWDVGVGDRYCKHCGWHGIMRL